MTRSSTIFAGRLNVLLELGNSCLTESNMYAVIPGPV